MGLTQSISSLIQDSFILENKIKRIQYMPYSEKIAKKVWHDILKNIIGKEPIYNEFNKQIFNQLIKWVHADDSCKYDLTKGIILAGRTGPGKTKTFETMKSYCQIDDVKYIKSGKTITLNYHIVNSRQIIADYANSGYEGIEKYSTYANICIDDLGNESEDVKYYGTSLNCIEEIIENRYLKGLMTHISTNLPLDEIAIKYSDRVYSRLKEMCNYVIFKGIDFRE
jgi:DNA replication protein DnaC